MAIKKLIDLKSKTKYTSPTKISSTTKITNIKTNIYIYIYIYLKLNQPILSKINNPILQKVINKNNFVLKRKKKKISVVK